MIPAVSQPAVPPPTITMLLMLCIAPDYQKNGGAGMAPPRGRGSEAVAGTGEIAPAIIEHVEQLVVEAPMRALLVVVDVLDFAKHAEMLVDVIARRQIELEARIDEGRLGTELAGVLVL